MRMKTIFSIVESNLSRAWANTFLALMEASGGQLHPSLVSIADFGDRDDLEEEGIRELLDDELRRHGESLSASVSGTIFPLSMWNPELPNNADALTRDMRKLGRVSRSARQTAMECTFDG